MERKGVIEKLLPFLLKYFIYLKFVVMCFTAVKGKRSAVLTTKTLFAYKKLHKKGDIFVSPILNHEWKIGKVYEERNFFKKVRPFSNSVNLGFHCFKTLSRARRSYTGTLVKVAIPKGSYVFENDEQYCSNKMSLVGPVDKRKMPKVVVVKKKK